MISLTRTWIAIIEQWGDDIENVVTTIPQECLQVCDEDLFRAKAFFKNHLWHQYSGPYTDAKDYRADTFPSLGRSPS
jgi:hypothetical protein